MTKRQAHTLMALAVAIIVTQILCTAVLLRSMERSRSTTEALRIDALDTSDMDTPAIATDTTGDTAQVERGTVLVDENIEPAVAPPAEPPTPVEAGPKADEGAEMTQQTPSLEAQRAQVERYSHLYRNIDTRPAPPAPSGLHR